MEYDLTIRHGQVHTSEGLRHLDIGVVDGRIAELALGLSPGVRDVDASGLYVLPGGIDSHCHIEQLSGMGVMCADDFYTATCSAAFGGTTTVIPFAAQHRGNDLLEVVEDYARCAREKAVIDYGFHLILTDPTETALDVHLPKLISEGITSFKVFMTYEALKLDDHQILDVLHAADKHGALVMVHAENNDIIRWVTRKLLESKRTHPKYHAVAHAPLAEAEATNRAITFSRLLNVPLLIVHVAGKETVGVIRAAQRLGALVYAESCPQYLFLTAQDIDLPGVEGAKYCCSPPPRDPESQRAVWEGLLDGSLALFSSDHAPFRFDESGKLPFGEETTFKQMANGVPGIELRMPLLFSEIENGRLTLDQFVRLTATNHAVMYGLYPRKGVIAPGSDADLALWDPAACRTISWDMLHDNVGYTPYEGRQVRGWPVMVFCRGKLVVEHGRLHAQPGDGQFIERTRPEPIEEQRRKLAAGQLGKPAFCAF